MRIPGTPIHFYLKDDPNNPKNEEVRNREPRTALPLAGAPKPPKTLGDFATRPRTVLGLTFVLTRPNWERRTESQANAAAHALATIGKLPNAVEVLGDTQWIPQRMAEPAATGNEAQAAPPGKARQPGAPSELEQPAGTALSAAPGDTAEAATAVSTETSTQGSGSAAQNESAQTSIQITAVKSRSQKGKAVDPPQVPDGDTIAVTPEIVLGLAQQVAHRTRLSTTGYQAAMDRTANPQRSDAASLMTLDRARQYVESAKQAFPAETLKNLAALQKNEVYRTSEGELLGGIEMTPEQLTESLKKCRQRGFANCDIQALEVALHLRYSLGLTNFSIVSNQKLSHNYVVIHPGGDVFPRGAIVDSWTGHGVMELNAKTKFKFRHFESNYKVNDNMHEWLEKYGAAFVRGDEAAQAAQSASAAQGSGSKS